MGILHYQIIFNGFGQFVIKHVKSQGRLIKVKSLSIQTSASTQNVAALRIYLLLRKPYRKEAKSFISSLPQGKV
jgi:hypothetical protein